MRSLISALLLAVPLGAPLAQTVRGAGARPCTEWSQARRGGGRDFEAEQWTLGYISALNVAAGSRAGSLFRMLDEKTVFAALDVYCSGHPDDMLWTAVKAAIAPAHGA